ncbi:MAG TPA: glycosyltransferase family 2 protein [Bryobacteraceae bacterium]|nr:glycosyltransferase family 2 protein [Bryobacteraceae bacterium]
MTPVPVSVLIPVKNEEANLAPCLRSVSWAGERVVVDSGSQDRTCAIAAEFGAAVHQFQYAPGGPKKKNWALENIPFRYDWVLILDADERITPELAADIAAAVANPGATAGYYINRRFYFLGRWIKHAGYFPSWNMRLIRKGKGFYERVADTSARTGDNEVHEHVILDGPSGRLPNPMDHFAFPTIDVFIEKHNRYSTWEAEAGPHATKSIEGGSGAIGAVHNARRTLKRAARKLPFPHWLRFFYHFFLKRGFLDGAQGYIFCHLLAEYEFWIWAKGRHET